MSNNKEINIIRNFILFCILVVLIVNCYLTNSRISQIDNKLYNMQDSINNIERIIKNQTDSSNDYSIKGLLININNELELTRDWLKKDRLY